MKEKLNKLSHQYMAALKSYLEKEPGVESLLASDLGREALVMGVVIAHLSAIHDQSVLALLAVYTSIERRNEMLVRAREFFIKVIAPLEEAHQKALDANVELTSLNSELSLRTEQLAAANLLLKQEIDQRHLMANALKTSEKTSSELLENALVMQEQLRNLSRQILLAQEEERKEISRELHDEIAQTLAGINVHLAALKREITVNDKQLNHRILLTQQLVEKSVDIVHKFATELRPTVLDDLGLIPALKSYIKAYTKRTGIVVEFNHVTGVEEMDNMKQTVFFRVAQEALTNVHRHAEASLVTMDLTEAPNAIQMQINDNGKAFVVQSVNLDKQNMRLGLIGMRERVEMVGGSFSIESSPATGTTISALIPFGSSDEGRRAVLSCMGTYPLASNEGPENDYPTCHYQSSI